MEAPTSKQSGVLSSIPQPGCLLPLQYTCINIYLYKNSIQEMKMNIWFYKLKTVCLIKHAPCIWQNILWIKWVLWETLHLLCHMQCYICWEIALKCNVESQTWKYMKKSVILQLLFKSSEVLFSKIVTINRTLILLKRICHVNLIKRLSLNSHLINWYLNEPEFCKTM